VAAAQEVPQWAGLRVANALGHGRGSLQVELNGEAWSVHGMEVGEVSSLRRVPPGRHRLRFQREGLAVHEAQLTLKADECITLVVHAGRVEDDAAWEIRVLKLEALVAGSGRMATVVDLGSEENRLLEIKQVGKSWETIALRRQELRRFSIVQHRGYLPMRVGRQPLPSLPVFEHGHHVVVLYESEGGRLGALCYRDRSWPVAETITR